MNIIFQIQFDFVEFISMFVNLMSNCANFLLKSCQKIFDFDSVHLFACFDVTDEVVI